MKNLNYLKLSMVIIPLLMITGCGDDPENEGNHLPTVKITSGNQVVNQGETINLQATAIDVDGDSLTYLWTIKDKPNGSDAQIDNRRRKNASFTADESGNYIVTFKANDGLSDSKIKSVTIRVSSDDPTPTPTPTPQAEDNTITDKTGIEGAWTIDRPKAEQIINGYEENNDPTGIFVALIITSMKDIQFKENGMCEISGMTDRDNSKKCWEANDDGYIFYGDNGEPSATIEISDNVLKIKFEESENSKAMVLEYSRVDEATLVPPSVVMKKDRVYHARDIELKDLNLKGSGYLIFTDKNEFYHLLTEKLNSLSLEELKEIKAKDERNEGGFLIETGAYQAQNGYYHVKNNAFYTVTDDKKIEVVTPSHINYDGDDYYLE